MTAGCPRCGFHADEATLQVDLQANMLFAGNTAIGLVPGHAVVAERLIRGRGQTVTTEQLIFALYGGPDYEPEHADNIVKVYVSALRKLLPPAFAIKNVWGVGYRLVSEAKAA